MIWVIRMYMLTETAAIRGRMAAGFMASLPGLTISRMPTKPMTMAVQRRAPTFSPSMGMERAVMMRGLRNMIAVASANGMSDSATYMQPVAPSKKPARSICRPGRRGLRKAKSPRSESTLKFSTL